jgi:hypothetical protein
MSKQHALINDEEGKLAEALAQTQDPKLVESEIRLDDANKKDSFQAGVQAELDAQAEEVEQEESSISKPAVEQKPGTEAKGEKVLDDKKEDVIPEPTPEEKEKEQKLQAELDKRLDQHPRFQELITERNALKPYAENAKLDEAFCQQNNIPPEQKKTAMELCALLNSNPDAALVQLEKLIENIKLSTGKLLPQDLAKEVTDGTISKERATELHMNRLRLAAQEQQSKVQQTSVQQQQQMALTTAMNQAAEVIVHSNPDFKPKVIPQGKTSDDVKDGLYELTYGKIQLMSMERYPRTPAEAVDILNRAYKWAQSVYIPTLPQRARRTLRTTDLSSFNDTTNGEPKSGETMAQYIQRTVGQRHGFTIGEG